VTVYASLAAEILRRVKANVNDATKGGVDVPADREHMVAAVRHALARRHRKVAFRRGAIRIGGRIGLLAAAVAVVVAAGRMVSRSGANTSARTKAIIADGSPSRAKHALSILESASASGSGAPVKPGASAVIGDGQARQPVTRGMALREGSRLSAPEAEELRLGSPEGTVLTLEAGGELQVVEQSSTRRLSLQKGAVRAQVAHLQPGERFIVATEDAEIEVHGTMFRVSKVDPDARCGDGTRTRVSVFEGVVSVRARGSESFVPAGGVWPSCEQSRVTPAVVAVSTSRGGSSRRASSTSLASQASVAGRAAPDGRLAMAAASPTAPAGIETAGLVAANDLFAAAARAGRERRPQDAIRLYSRLIELAPDGPLAEGAMAQRMKLLGAVDRGSAGRAAAEYLARYPDGFARVDARQLAGSRP